MDAAELKTRLGDGKTGTYILCLQLKYARHITIGKLGSFEFEKGYYYYVGSAFGPGGVAARCKHHINISQKPRWHIDYLRAHCNLIEIYFAASATHKEHIWATQLANVMQTAVSGFGSSDCDCTGHLFFASNKHEIKLDSQNEKEGKALLFNLSADSN